MIRNFLNAFLLIALLSCACVQAQSTNPSIRSGGSLPSACTPGSSRSSLFYKTGASSGLYQCLTTNNWTPVGSGTGSAAAAGSGTEVQINSAGALAALTGSSASGPNLNLGGQLSVTGGNVLAGRDPVTVTETSEADFDSGTLSNTNGNSDGTLSLLDAGNGTTKAIRFNGSRSNQVSIPHNAAYNLTGDMTIEAWVNLANPVAFSPIASKGISGQTFDLVVQSGGGGALGYGWIRFGQGGSYTNTEGVATLRLNQWQHVAVVKSGTTLKFFINGVLVKTATGWAPTVPTNTSALTLGHAADTFVTAGYLFRGSIFDTRIWNVARSDAEIAANFNTLTPAGSGLVGQWRMQEGSGTTVADSSATANNGTLSGLDYAWQTITRNYATSGTRTSPAYDISLAKTISTSSISWTETKPVGHTLTIETRYSTNGGSSYSSWTAATNGGTIPGLNTSVDLSNGRLQIRETFSSPTTKDSALLAIVTATFTTPAYQYKLGVQNASPSSVVDAGTNTIQGKFTDVGGAVLNVTAARFGAIPDDGQPDDAAFRAAIDALGPAIVGATTSSGRILVPKGTYDFSNDLEFNRIVDLDGVGTASSILSFADGKGVKIPACEVFGAYGTDQGCGNGSFIRDLKIASKGKSNTPSSTVNINGLAITRTAGDFFNAERWATEQVVLINGSIYAKIDVWLSETTGTLAPLEHTGSVSGNTVTLVYGNPFPAGLSGVAVKIDGVSYTINSSTTSSLTLSSSPTETGNRLIEIQSLGTINGATLKVFAVHGIEASGVVHLRDVTVSGFAGNGIDLNTGNYNFDNARNGNTFYWQNVLSIDNEGHGFFVFGFNSNAGGGTVINGFNNKGHGLREGSSYGNGWLIVHTDSNRMRPVVMGSGVLNYLYSEGNQPCSTISRGVSGATIIGGFIGSGLCYNSNAARLDNGGSLINIKSLTLSSDSDGITSPSQMLFSGATDSTRRISFGYGVSGATESSSIQQNNGSLLFFSNTQSNGGSFGTPTSAAIPSWLQSINSAGDHVRWFRAPATAGAPSFSQIAEISPTGFSTNNITAGGKLYVTNPETPASASASCSVGQHAWDSNFVYVCVATNTWKRSALSTW